MLRKYKTEPKFIEVKDSNRVVIKLMFFCDYNKKDIIKRSLMERLMTNSNSRYKKIMDFKNRKDELMIIKYDISHRIYINKQVVVATLSIPKEGLIDGFDSNKCLEFLYLSVFSPNVCDGEFNHDNFNWERDYLYNKEKNYPYNIYDFIDDKMDNEINKIDDIYLTHDEYLENINSVTSKEVYNYYLKNIKNNDFITYIYGNMDNKERIFSSYNKYFNNKKKSIELDINYYHFLKYKECSKDVIMTKYNQSCLDIIFTIKDLKEDELIYMDMLYFFLNARENDLVFKVLRNKYNLIYFSRVYEESKYGYIEIKAFLSRDNIDRAKMAIKEVFKDICIKDNFDMYKERLLRALKYDIYAKEDDNYSIIQDIFDKELNKIYSLEEEYELIGKIDIDLMKKFIDRIVILKEISFIGGNSSE